MKYSKSIDTREAQTADQYIEKFAHDNRKRYDITVATSDNLQQVIIRGAGCAVWSANDLKKELEWANETIPQAYREKQTVERTSLKDKLSPQMQKRMEAFLKEEQQ